MKATLQKAFRSGLLRRIFFWTGIVLLLGFCFIILALPVIDSLLYHWKGICIDFEPTAPFGAACLFSGTLCLLATYFLPTKKRRPPHTAIPAGSDRYLDQESEFSDEEREAILQESWMAIAERFNRNRVR